MATTLVRCTFDGKVYDLTRVTVTARYADCSMFRTPCCGRLVDDRTFVSLPAFTRLTDEEAAAHRDGRPMLRRDGTWAP